jgi:hypothetical protein
VVIYGTRHLDRLLPSQRPVPPPFSQNECQELMNLLRSFDGSEYLSRLRIELAHFSSR